MTTDVLKQQTNHFNLACPKLKLKLEYSSNYVVLIFYKFHKIIYSYLKAIKIGYKIFQNDVHILKHPWT